MSYSRREFLGAVGGATLAASSAVDLLAQGQPADLLLYNGKIVTVDSAFSIHQAIVVKDGRVVAVGGNELRNRYAAARTIDLRGRTVIPGFHDTHIHLAGHSRRYIDLNETTSLAQLKQQVSEKAKELGPREWITGAGLGRIPFHRRRAETASQRSGCSRAQQSRCSDARGRPQLGGQQQSAGTGRHQQGHARSASAASSRKTPAANRTASFASATISTHAWSRATSQPTCATACSRTCTASSS